MLSTADHGREPKYNIWLTYGADVSDVRRRGATILHKFGHSSPAISCHGRYLTTLLSALHSNYCETRNCAILAFICNTPLSDILVSDIKFAFQVHSKSHQIVLNNLLVEKYHLFLVL